MANEDNPQEEIQQPQKNNKLIYGLIVLIAVLIITVGVGAWYVTSELKQQQPPTNQHTMQDNKEEQEDYYEDNNEVGHIVQFDQMIINLSSAKGKKNYLKIQINIEFRDDDTQGIYKKRKPLLFDALLTAASNRSKEELMTIGGKEEFKMELKEEFNDIMGQKAIKNIYWKTFVIQ